MTTSEHTVRLAATLEFGHEPSEAVLPLGQPHAQVGRLGAVEHGVARSRCLGRKVCRRHRLYADVAGYGKTRESKRLHGQFVARAGAGTR